MLTKCRSQIAKVITFGYTISRFQRTSSRVCRHVFRIDPRGLHLTFGHNRLFIYGLRIVLDGCAAIEESGRTLTIIPEATLSLSR
jgi:hypothetical protein